MLLWLRCKCIRAPQKGVRPKLFPLILFIFKMHTLSHFNLIKRSLVEVFIQGSLHPKYPEFTEVYYQVYRSIIKDKLIFLFSLLKHVNFNKVLANTIAMFQILQTTLKSSKKLWWMFWRFLKAWVLPFPLSMSKKLLQF